MLFPAIPLDSYLYFVLMNNCSFYMTTMEIRATYIWGFPFFRDTPNGWFIVEDPTMGGF